MIMWTVEIHCYILVFIIYFSKKDADLMIKAGNSLLYLIDAGGIGFVTVVKKVS